MIDWHSSENHLLLNPQLPSVDAADAHALFRGAPTMSAQVWVATSGSTRAVDESVRLVALSKAALLASARAVNTHLHVTAADVWYLALPIFHVGGLGILARASLHMNSVITGKTWSTAGFCEAIDSGCVTLSALVPTQIFDLVTERRRAPPHLRAIVVGGGSLSESLYHQARELGWPLLPSFGMTESCSQVATASLQSLQQADYPKLQILSHWQVQTDEENRLGLKGASLLSLYAQKRVGQSHYWDPKREQIFWSEDRVQLKGDTLEILGRGQDFVKIHGENVNLSELNAQLQRLDTRVAQGSVILARADVRSGSRIVLVTEVELTSTQQADLLARFAAQVLPVARIQDVYHMERLPRSALGKILREDVFKLIAESSGFSGRRQ